MNKFAWGFAAGVLASNTTNDSTRDMFAIKDSPLSLKKYGLDNNRTY